MNAENDEMRPRSLREIELEVELEGREWTRRRLQQRLQEEANRLGGTFPPDPTTGGASANSTDDPANPIRERKSGGRPRSGSKG
jgi:hypothetical protein